MKKIVSLLLVLYLFPFVVFAWECGTHVEYGVPGSADQFLCREAYAVGYSYTHKQPLWTAYHISKDSVAKRFKRSNDFKEDQEIPKQYRSLLTDYKGSGYDRGHMAPAATIDVSEEAMQESFLLSNMSPQLPGLNRQGWRYLEEYVRDWTKSRGDLYVFTGPIFSSTDKHIGNGVTIPSAYYKIIYDANLPGDAIAFIVPHFPANKEDLRNLIVSVDLVEEKTGLDFMPYVPDDMENKIEEETELLWGDSQ